MGVYENVSRNVQNVRGTTSCRIANAPFDNLFATPACNSVPIFARNEVERKCSDRGCAGGKKGFQYRAKLYRKISSDE